MEARKDWDGLAKLAEENLAKDRKNAGWWFVAGYAHSQAGRHQRAIECYREMVRLAPDDMVGWSILAQSYRDAEAAAAGGADAQQRARGAQGHVPPIWFLLGESYADLGRDLRGRRRTARRSSWTANSPQAWFGLGRASARLGRRTDYESALKALERLDPALAKELAELRPGPR